MRLISWNVNGLRACMGKGFLDFFNGIGADAVCLQETKMQPHQLELELPGYVQFWNSAEKKGYSGTAIFTKHQPLAVTYGIGMPEHDTEGRVITCEYEHFYLVTVYTPNAQQGLARIDYRMAWEDAFRDYLLELDRVKPVIVCGDMNVAHTGGTPAFPTRSGRPFPVCWKAGSPTPSERCTRSWRGYTAGGAIASTPGTTTPGGASTIFWSPTACGTRWRPRPSSPRSMAATTAP